MSSDKTLLTVAIIAFVLSLATVIASFGGLFTGNAASDTASGDAQLTIDQNLEITFNNANVDWGSGRVDNGKNAAVLTTQGDTINSTGSNSFTAVNNPLTLENTGNINASINVSSNKDADNFIGGGQASDAPDPRYGYEILESEGDSCLQSGNIQSSTTSFTGSGNQQPACGNVPFRDSDDVIGIDLLVKVPYDAPSTSKTATITATASPV